MISSQEFHQKLQAGQIHEALTLVMRSAIELDITTRIAEDLEQSQSASNEYLRTKIDLLTGSVENEVSKNVVTDSPNYLKLQQLHLDRITTTHQIVRDYLHQIRAILTVLPAPEIENMLTHPSVECDPVNADMTAVASVPLTKIELDDDDDFDLSIDRDGEVWEEWVEDEEFMADAGEPQPPAASPILTLPDRAETSPLPRQFYPIEVKPIVPRSTSAPVDAPSAWDKFAPEYIGIGADPQPRRIIDSDADRRLDELLTNLDI
jgi:hypothetical protein